MPLTDIPFRLAYTPENCADFVAEFYGPVLAQAVRYDRTTYTFSAAGLQTAARGVAGLLSNGGRIRLICDHQVTPETHAAIVAGRQQAAAILRREVAPADLTAVSPDDICGREELDLLTWLVAENRLDIRVAIVPNSAIFHDKIGIVADSAGNCIAFHGSLNETRAGVRDNYESFDVFTSWRDRERAADKAEQFETLWQGESRFAYVTPLPDEYDAYLREYAARHRQPALTPEDMARRAAYWERIRDGLRDDPASTVATVPAELWPHQAAFFNRHAAHSGPDRLLVADEVGLGKTIQAGILAKLRINQGRVSRLLVLAPKPACPQWQDELHRKFNIHIPRLETGARATLAYPDGSITDAPDPPWSAATLIASYQWLRQHKDAFLASEPRHDLVIVDEAHRARFSDVANASRRRPNQYLQLLRGLAPHAKSLLLLTATPMQLHEAELHALLELLEPVGWTAEDFRRFYDDAAPQTPEAWRELAELYRPQSPNPQAGDERLIHSPNQGYVARQLDAENIARTTRLMRERGPARRLMSRHTRATLRQYAREGRVQAVPDRHVRPIAITMNRAERRLYDDIDALVKEVYAGAPGINDMALGFVMTTYRKRLGSSPRAFAQTCRNHLERQQADAAAWRELTGRNDEELDDDPDTPLPGTTLSRQAASRLEQAARDAGRLERRDTKLSELRRRLDALRAGGHRKIIIFTQFRDTMLYLLERLSSQDYGRVVGISGQDDPAQGSRAQRIKALRDAAAGLLIATETASESLNLQFCSAMVNYDVPWNPMTLEQRIGRIDRIGQESPTVDIFNLFYENTAEWDAYEAMLERLNAIHGNVGEYQPILYDAATANRLSGIIRANGDRQATRDAVRSIASAARLNLDTLNSALGDTAIAAPAIGMADIQRALTEPGLLPDGWTAQHRGGPHWQITRPEGGRRLVTTSAEAYEYDGSDAEWFGPGSPWCPA